MVKVEIPINRKCHGTVDMICSDNDYASVPAHGRKKLLPKRASLSFKHNSVEVEIEFTKRQWNRFVKDIQKVTWKAEEHYGAC